MTIFEVKLIDVRKYPACERAEDGGLLDEREGESGMVSQCIIVTGLHISTRWTSFIYNFNVSSHRGINMATTAVACHGFK